ncbi:MAG TPA: hypothetical protein VEL07_09465 [Planctomycetota bacterium]|nr:hypothetical protein [Planctomycetota bacterium]
MDERTLLIVNSFFRDLPDVPKLKSLLRARLGRDLGLDADEAMMLVESLITAGVLNEITVRCERDGWKQSIIELADDEGSTIIEAVVTRRYSRAS